MMPKAPYHSMYFGAPYFTPCSMKSKSSTRFKAAMAQTKRLKPMPMGPDPLIVTKWMCEEAQDDLQQVEERDAASRRDDADAELVGHLNQARA